MEYVQEFFIVASIHLLAVMSPGPDFALITRNSLVYSRQTGIRSALGLGLGILVHVTYSLIGIGLLISQSIILFNTVKWIGALYLIYIGYKSLRAKKVEPHENETQKEQRDLSLGQAVRTGFLTNVLNPKATLFFLSLFTQVIDPTTPMGVQILYGLEMGLVTFLWFALVAILLSQHQIKKRFQRVQHYGERVMGAILIALGIKVAFSASK